MTSPKETWTVSLPDEITIIDCRNNEVAVASGDYETDYERMAANARMIALAPELYEYVASSASAGCATAQALIARI